MMKAGERFLTEFGCLVAYLVAAWFIEFMAVVVVCLINRW